MRKKKSEHIRPDFKIKEEALSSNMYIYVRPIKKKPIASEVFHRDRIDRDILQQAVDLSLKRMPYMADTLVKKGIRFYYAEDPLPFEVAETDKIRHIGGPETNYHMIDVTCHDNVTIFAAAHEFCDGQGLQFFLESVLYNYYCIRDGVDYDPGHMRTGRTAMTEEEYRDPCKMLPRNKRGYKPKFEPFSELSENEPGFISQGEGKTGLYHLPEFGTEDYDTIHLTSLSFPSEEFMTFVKECKSSPAVVLSLMMGEAVLRIHPDADRMIRAVVPLSSRKAIGCMDTFKNCSNRAELPAGGTSLDDRPFAYRAEYLRGVLLSQIDPEVVRPYERYVCDSLEKLVKSRLGYRRIVKILERFSTESFDSFFLDYTGRLHTPGYGDKIEYFNSLCRPVGNCPVHLNVHEFNGRFRISYLSREDVPCYYDALKDVMNDHGLKVLAEDPRQIVLPDTEWDYGMKL